MEMKVSKQFYMLEGTGSRGSLVLFDTIDDAVQSVGQWIKKEGNTKGLSLCEVEVDGEEVTVTGVPWSTITELLFKGTKK